MSDDIFKKIRDEGAIIAGILICFMVYGCLRA